MAKNSKQKTGSHIPYILGLDIGTNSCGWAVVALSKTGQPIGLLKDPDGKHPAMGVRIFDAGMKNLDNGKREESHAVKRRIARHQRRQLARRSRKRKKIFGLLQSAGLLPQFAQGAYDDAGGEQPARDQLLKALDQELSNALASREPEMTADAHERLPLLLRARGLDEPLTPLELGRALYNLAQRRGFLSNRKSDAQDDEELGVVKTQIGELGKAMEAIDPETGEPRARTLGEYLFKLNPDEERARSRWTARKMFEVEFEALWKAQAPHHPKLLTDDFHKKLHRAFFHQRPLKSQRNLIGLCEFENGGERVHTETGEVYTTLKRRRAPACLPIAQRFVLLQKVNDLRICAKNANDKGVPLDEDQRRILIGALEENGRMTMAQARKLVGIKPRDKKVFSLERGGEKSLPGNRANAEFLKLFGERWKALDEQDQELAVLALWDGTSDEVIKRHARERRGIWAKLKPTSSEAEGIPKIPLSQDYMSLSRRALSKIVPELEKGIPYATAWNDVYGPSMSKDIHDTLPPLLEGFGDLRNPVVTRALTEVRHTVNAIIRYHGKPSLVRVELARDLKKNAEQRQEAIKLGRANEEKREAAAKRIIEEAGLSNPRGGDLLKARLWEECGHLCPYTGATINFTDLFGADVDIEHIIPFSRSLDDSFMNKTLCMANYNRKTKGNKTPVEVTGGEGEDWEGMVNRMTLAVQEHGMPKYKLELFQLAGDELDAHLDGFANRQLSDTRYISRQARAYLTLLFGGHLERGVDAEGKTRVQVGNGQATALLRNSISGLNRFLKENGKKSRDDHRHHAVDALATALTSHSIIQELADLASDPANPRPGRIPPMEEPWEDFSTDVNDALDALWVSNKVANRVRGALHEETLYSPPRDDQGRRVDETHEGDRWVHFRKPIWNLKESELERIIDPGVRDAVKKKLQSSGKSDPGKVFKDDDPSTWPVFGTRRPRRIRHVRIRKKDSSRPLAKGHRIRFVDNKENHHLEILKTTDKRGREKWIGEMVTLDEAYRRTRAGNPVVRRDHGEGREFLFSLAKGEVFKTASPTETGQVFRVRNTTHKAKGTIMIRFQEINDARIYSKISNKGLNATPSALQKLGARKLTLDPGGIARDSRA